MSMIQTPAIPAWAARNPEWASALYVLTAPGLQNKARQVWRQVDFERRRIGFPDLRDEAGPWSHGERILLCAAWLLFNGGDRRAFTELLDGELLAEAVTTLDTDNLRLLLDAIRLRRPDVVRP